MLMILARLARSESFWAVVKLLLLLLTLCVASAGALYLLVLQRKRRVRALVGHSKKLHALEGMLRRLHRTPHRELLVLRGGLLLRGYCPQTPRQPADLDFLGEHENDLEATLAMLRDVCTVAVGDGLEFDAQGVVGERTWTETEHPALKASVPYRLRCDAGWETCSVDVGWGDPLVPPAHAVALRAVVGGRVPCARAARLETLFGWKLHGLFEREAAGLSAQGIPKGYWRPKDLFDLYLMARCGALDAALLPAAVEVAFSSRGYPLSRVVRVAHGHFASGPTSKKNWARWRASLLDAHGGALPPHTLAVPAEPAPCVAAVAAPCAAVLRALGYAALPGEETPIAPAWQVLAEWATLIVPSEYKPPEALRFPPGLATGAVSPADAARGLALHCHAALGAPVIVDLVYLELYSADAAHGGRLYHRIGAADERAFAKAHAGAAGAMRAVVAYTADGQRVEVLEGELEGRVVHPVRGAAPYGWNRCWEPDGCAQTLGEMGSSFYAIHPRLKPLLELASRLRSETAYGVLEGNRGLFELHVTVDTPTEAQGGLATFREACAACKVKAVLIENSLVEPAAKSARPTQLMTASYVKGTLPEVHVAAFRLSQRLVGYGFSVSRVKIESTFSNPGVPHTDAEAAALSPHNYWEFHWKLRLPASYDHAALAALVGTHDARLSRSALRSLGGGYHHRFVTLRLYDMGRSSAQQRLEALSAALHAAQHEVGTVIREYAVYDSNETATIYHYRENVKEWSGALMLARGLVVREPRHGAAPELLATPFPKFFDLGADGVSLDELLARSVAWEATEKLDGSLGLLFHDGGAWRLTTKRAWHSEQAAWGRAWLEGRAVWAELSRGTTYVCELLFASNLVVVRYPASREGVTLCAAYDADGRELPRAELADHARRAALPLGLIVRFAFADGGCHRAKAVSLAAAAGVTDDRSLAACLKGRTHWEDGSPVTAAQRRLAHHAWGGKLGGPPPAEGEAEGETAARLEAMGTAPRLALFSCVAVPGAGEGGIGEAVRTADGTPLLNHRRPAW
ncbi:hypothetical protein EMIHUDRAFT_229565 [Emiliania huxleyi CCMP1516]|uniref:T4 RNA ligase 1-like N-terminal domain-containing protein n=2 Tax=Emiliania huxleyi TaxID=2903 RepID=A0A0D3KCX2_EMIH1|nr:hypothetical protein EMIHUDRAFT_229565 [Emiliania huxleyi CCMP1516]EOD33607.1 hypothetical protein EMIHUDRAFT_229565 [Emiliania huxleyi CCMP1516]|eukprot:XP_005786036.1 hypothetical protein EMIHUDRAFT_229565 [Emiliania huxleyi CCMP1516]